MKFLFIISFIILLTGCNSEESQLRNIKRKEYREESFKQCMELAAKLERQSDDDVSDIIQECDSRAYYMSVYIK